MAAFVLGLAVTVAIVFVLPTPRDARYDVLTADALHLTDAYRRITRDAKPIDVAFIGSSHTMNGIDDQDVEAGLARDGLKLSVANLGVPWAGRDLELLIAKLLFARKSPKLVIIELDQHEEPAGHRLLPYVADTSDMFCCKEYLDYDYPSAVLAFLRRQMRAQTAAIWREPPPREAAPRDYGWVPLHGAWTEQQAAISRKMSQLDGPYGFLKVRFFQMASPFGLGAVQQMVDLAQAHGTKVAFLYLPARHYLTGGPPITNLSFYRAIGPILNVPEKLFEDDGYWANWSHINEQGAEQLVPCLIADVARLSAPGAETGDREACGGGGHHWGEPFASQR